MASIRHPDDDDKPDDQKTGKFVYQSELVKSSIRANGEVYFVRDKTGHDTETIGLDPITVRVPVLNAREISGAAPFSLDQNGFELTIHSYKHIDYYDEGQIIGVYYAEIESFLKQKLGASQVYCFDHNIRSSEGKALSKKIVGGNAVQGPAHIVHNDYTLTSAPLRLKLLSEPAKINDAWKPLRPPDVPLIAPEELETLMSTRRYAFVNVWRNISENPVKDQPLAMCDATTLSPEEDLLVLEIQYPDRTGENYFSRRNERHRWYYYPDLHRDEVIILKVWDTAGVFHRDHNGGNLDLPSVPATFSLHSAFIDDTTPADYEKRQSIEIRTVVFF